MPRHFFITGTDTGVGKTHITGLLARQLLAGGHRIVTQKWVQTGAFVPADILEHDRLAGLCLDASWMPLRCPYLFQNALSPHLAASLAGQTISINRLKKDFEKLSDFFDTVLVEGAGGILVPLTPEVLLIDVAIELGLEVIVVAPNRVGAINHALLTIRELQRRKAAIAGIVWNAMDETVLSEVLKDNPESVCRIGGIRSIQIEQGNF